MRSGAKWALITVVGLVAAFLLVFGGFLLGMDPDVGGSVRDLLPAGFFGSSDTDGDYELQQEVLRKLESSYYKEIDVEELQTGAIDGMLAGLGDPYTTYLDPREYAEFLESSSGSYSGVGMVVEMKDNLVTIVSTFKDSPAEIAGIQSGDIILAVDGVSTDGLSLDEVVTKIKGPEGTTVILEMYRPVLSTTTTIAGQSEGGNTGDVGSTADVSQLPGGGEITEYTLTRKTIAIPVTESEVLEVADKEVAFIAFFTFSEGSADELRTEVQRAVERDGADVVILDLRSNGGGLLDEAIDVASIFIPEGEVVSTEGLHSPEQVYHAGGDAFAHIPLYVLTDAYTASASEIVSGALQDYERAVLVGETTFGKGLVQSISSLSNGGALKMTTAVYLTPDGRNINETGIVPDVVAPDDPATTEVDEALETVLDLISGVTAED
ncbi:MAG: S41 family peptidase [Actinobacteria bacterium]|nr:S41 family peptidase [Actinomycetota bacterium]